MDSLDRLSHSIEAAAALIHSLRRENRELAHAVALNAPKAALGEKAEGLEASLQEARLEIERMRREPMIDTQAQERARQAELESARLAEQVEKERDGSAEMKRELQKKI